MSFLSLGYPSKYWLKRFLRANAVDCENSFIFSKERGCTMLHFNKILNIYNAEAKKMREAIFLHFLINFPELEELIMLVSELFFFLCLFSFPGLKSLSGAPQPGENKIYSFYHFSFPTNTDFSPASFSKDLHFRFSLFLPLIFLTSRNLQILADVTKCPWTPLTSQKPCIHP